MEFMDKVSKRIVELREAKGETQQELADAIGITRQSLSRYEIATRTINVDVLGALAQHFNVTTDYLLGLSDIKSTEQDMKIACEVTGLSEKAVKKIASYELSAIDFYTYDDTYPRCIVENGFSSRGLITDFIESDSFQALFDSIGKSLICQVSDIYEKKLLSKTTYMEVLGCRRKIDTTFFCNGHYFEISKAYIMDAYEALKQFVDRSAKEFIVEDTEEEDTKNAQHNPEEE